LHSLAQKISGFHHQLILSSHVVVNATRRANAQAITKHITVLCLLSSQESDKHSGDNVAFPTLFHCLFLCWLPPPRVQTYAMSLPNEKLLSNFYHFHQIRANGVGKPDPFSVDLDERNIYVWITEQNQLREDLRSKSIPTDEAAHEKIHVLEAVPDFPWDTRRKPVSKIRSLPFLTITTNIGMGAVIWNPVTSYDRTTLISDFV
jgi:hypothetical protein